MRSTLNTTIAGLVLFSSVALCWAEDLTGAWIAQVSAKGSEAQYARVQLQTGAESLNGSWNEMKLEGSIAGDRVNFAISRSGVSAGNFTGTSSSGVVSGAGQMNGNQVTWKLTRQTPPPAKPRTIDFEPTIFHGYYAANIPPVLRIFPGDTVRTRTYDASGRDADRRTPGSNLETGPFFVEGALPGDTLAIKLNKVRLNRDSARQGSRINGRAVTPAWIAPRNTTQHLMASGNWIARK